MQVLEKLNALVWSLQDYGSDVLESFLDRFLITGTDFNSCRSSPCNHNGTCINNGANAFICNCAAGYTGTTCEQSNATFEF